MNLAVLKEVIRSGDEFAPYAVDLLEQYKIFQEKVNEFIKDRQEIKFPKSSALGMWEESLEENEKDIELFTKLTADCSKKALENTEYMEVLREIKGLLDGLLYRKEYIEKRIDTLKQPARIISGNK
jgi:hypothetical protein